MTTPARPRRGPSVDELAAGCLAGDRALLARAITLVESNRIDHQERAQELLRRLLPHTGGARRIGITGVPGVGKSSFIEAMGSRLVDDGHKLAVLAIDPSSSRTGGSVMGDKTRMGRLSMDERAFVRPSPSSGSLGGVARKTRETLLLCEAAGYGVVLVETVGVGQSEAMVADMVDAVLLLLLPGAGDELQGIKRGLLELVDVVAVNKADGDRVTAARQARVEYASALRLVRGRRRGAPPVLVCSSQTGAGLDDVWAALEEHRGRLESSGELAAQRQRQDLRWMWALLEDGLMARFRGHPVVADLLPRVEASIVDGETTPTRAARRLLELFLGGGPDAGAET
ncbi:MAG: methylmalonyl Co-A mutase-associated GTPase MeaB [Acidobacteriota bacterium]